VEKWRKKFGEEGGYPTTAQAKQKMTEN